MERIPRSRPAARSSSDSPTRRMAIGALAGGVCPKNIKPSYADWSFAAKDNGASCIITHYGGLIAVGFFIALRPFDY
jgi:hypothetical protein